MKEIVLFILILYFVQLKQFVLKMYILGFTFFHFISVVFIIIYISIIWRNIMMSMEHFYIHFLMTIIHLSFYNSKKRLFWMNIKVFQIDLSFFLPRIYKLEFILIYLICFKFSNFLHFLTQNSKKNASIFNVNSVNFSSECLKQCLFYALTSLKCVRNIFYIC